MLASFIGTLEAASRRHADSFMYARQQKLLVRLQLIRCRELGYRHSLAELGCLALYLSVLMSFYAVTKSLWPLSSSRDLRSIAHVAVIFETYWQNVTALSEM